MTGTATAATTQLGGWLTLDSGAYRLSADTTDSRLRATVGGLDSVSKPEGDLAAGSYLAYIVVTMSVGDGIDATITPMLSSTVQ
ncbi:hypothetical protein JS533_001670 [Bifidobacterium amazonense]|uniref:Adhesin n=1 Tax=Bifidobacterium amazonense TaxID=2809027 RepID=A0ABS9VSD6_9BIFI|nr:hypothetical protein [Bifidobacterium amazonense]MCH9274997.1 hypothetical protein [Bifidobacterium amazonense]